MNMTAYARLWAITAMVPSLSEYVTDSDFDYYHRRILAEGLPFVTLLLPKYGKAAERYHENGYFCDPGGLEIQKDSPFPVFLHKAWAAMSTCSVEDRETNWQVIAGATRAIRQLTMLFYKLEVEPVTTKQETWDHFVATDLALRDVDLFASHDLRNKINAARQFVERLIGRKPNMEKFVGRHGSGASACGIKPANRYGSERTITGLCSVFPEDLYCSVNWNHCCDISSASVASNQTRVSGWVWRQRGVHQRNDDGRTYYQWLSEEDLDERDNPYHWCYVHETVYAAKTDLCSKVAFVWKNILVYRLICEEVRELMFFQQGLRFLLEERVASSPWAKDLDFRDQTRQQVLAREASLNKERATIDMKDASDRVSYALVERLMPPEWFVYLSACRSSKASCELPGPNGEPIEHTIELNKFAPMGSSTCFPVEQIVFWALCRASVPTWAHVSAFGDDLIVDSEYMDNCVHTLESCGLLVNRDKSFVNGFLRESCGGYYLNGLDISIVQLKKPLQCDHDGIASACNYLNNLFGKYYAHTVWDGWNFHPMFRNTVDDLIHAEWEDVVEAYLCEELGAYNIPFAKCGKVVRKTGDYSTSWPTPFVIVGNSGKRREAPPWPWPIDVPSPISYNTGSTCRHSRRMMKTYVQEPVRDVIPEIGWSLLFRWFSHREPPVISFENILEENLYRERQDTYVPGLPLLTNDPCGYTLSSFSRRETDLTLPKEISHTVATRLFKYVSRSVALPG